MAQTTAVAIATVIYDGENCVFIGRLRAFDGTYLDTNNVSGFAVFVYGPDGTVLYSLGNITPGAGLSDTLIVDYQSAILGDDVGRNFQYVITPDLYNPEGGNVYPVEFVFDTTSWGDMIAQGDIVVRPSRSR